MVHTSRHPGLPVGQLAPGGVERKVTPVGQIALGDPRHTSPFRAEPGVLERHQNGDGVTVVNRGHVDVIRPEPGHVERPPGRPRDRGDHRLLRIGHRLERDVLAKALDPHRAVPRTPRQVGVGDQHTGSAVDRHDGLQHVDRVGNHRATQHVGLGDGLTVEHRAGMGACVGALIHRDLRQRRRVVSVLGAVALRDLGERGVLADVAVRDLVLGLG